MEKFVFLPSHGNGGIWFLYIKWWCFAAYLLTRLFGGRSLFWGWPQKDGSAVCMPSGLLWGVAKVMCPSGSTFLVGRVSLRMLNLSLEECSAIMLWCRAISSQVQREVWVGSKWTSSSSNICQYRLLPFSQTCVCLYGRNVSQHASAKVGVFEKCLTLHNLKNSCTGINWVLDLKLVGETKNLWFYT